MESMGMPSLIGDDGSRANRINIEMQNNNARLDVITQRLEEIRAQLNKLPSTLNDDVSGPNIHQDLMLRKQLEEEEILLEKENFDLKSHLEDLNREENYLLFPPNGKHND